MKWTAKTFNLQVTTAASLFDIVNFAIIVLAIGIPLYRLLPKTLRQRKEKVRNDIEAARKVTEDANSRLSAVEAKLAKLDEEIAKFRAEVEEEIGRDEARIKAWPPLRQSAGCVTSQRIWLSSKARSNWF